MASLVAPIIGSVAGAAASSLFGGGKSGATQTQAKSMPAWLSTDWQNLASDAQTQAATPFQAYTGQSTAPLSTDEQTAFQSLRDLMGSSNSIYANSQNTLGNVINRATNGPSAGDIQGLMNPYTQDVLQSQNLLTMQNYDRQMQSLKSQAVNGGAFGGSGDYIQRALAQKNLGQQLASNNATGLSNAFNQGMQQWNTNTGTLGQTAFGQANLAGNLQNLNTAGASALAGAGATQRGITQQGDTFNYNEFLRQIQDPSQKQSTLANILGQASPSFTGTTTNLTQNPNQLNSLIGGATAGGSLGSSIANYGTQQGWWGGNSGSTQALNANDIWGSGSSGSSGGFLSGLFGSGSSGSGMLTMKKGGLVKGYAKGGMIKVPKIKSSMAKAFAPDYVSPHNLIHGMRSNESTGRLDRILNMNTGINDTDPVKMQKYDTGGLVNGLYVNPLSPDSMNGSGGPSLLDYFRNSDNGVTANPSNAAFNNMLNDVATNMNQGSGDKGVVDNNVALPTAKINPNVVNDLDAQDDSSVASAPPKPVGSADSNSVLNDIINRALIKKAQAEDQPKSFSEEANTPMLAMGLSMMASNNPNFGGALNEGFNAFQKSTQEQQALKDKKLKDLIEMADSQRKMGSQGIEDQLKQAQTQEALARAKFAGGYKPLSPNQKLASYTRFLAPKMSAIDKAVAQGMMSPKDADAARLVARSEANKDYAMSMGQIGMDPSPPTDAELQQGGGGPSMDQASILRYAKYSIARGAPKDKIIESLKAQGIDTSGL